MLPSATFNPLASALAEKAQVRRVTVVKLERGGNVDAQTLLKEIRGRRKTLSLTKIGRPVY